MLTPRPRERTTVINGRVTRGPRGIIYVAFADLEHAGKPIGDWLGSLSPPSHSKGNALEFRNGAWGVGGLEALELGDEG